MNNIFHWCSLAAGSIANDMNKLQDSEFVRRIAYAMYEATLKQLNEDKNEVSPTR
jgi:hypothetical protein